MIRTQVQLTEEQHRRLKQIAHEQGISLAEVVRRFVDRGLDSGALDRATLYARAAKLVGAFHAKEKDLSVNHDKYLDEDYGH